MLNFNGPPKADNFAHYLVTHLRRRSLLHSLALHFPTRRRLLLYSCRDGDCCHYQFMWFLARSVFFYFCCLPLPLESIVNHLSTHEQVFRSESNQRICGEYPSCVLYLNCTIYRRKYNNNKKPRIDVIIAREEEEGDETWAIESEQAIEAFHFYVISKRVVSFLHGMGLESMWDKIRSVWMSPTCIVARV